MQGTAAPRKELLLFLPLFFLLLRWKYYSVSRNTFTTTCKLPLHRARSHRNMPHVPSLYVKKLRQGSMMLIWQSVFLQAILIWSLWRRGCLTLHDSCSPDST